MINFTLRNSITVCDLGTCELNNELFATDFDIDMHYKTAGRNTCSKNWIFQHSKVMASWTCGLADFAMCKYIVQDIVPLLGLADCLHQATIGYKYCKYIPLKDVGLWGTGGRGSRYVSHSGSFICITRAQLLIIFELNMLEGQPCVQQCTKAFPGDIWGPYSGLPSKYLVVSIKLSSKNWKLWKVCM